MSSLSTFVALILTFYTTSVFGDNLPAFNVDIRETSLSGLSSGAYMAVQVEVAHSDIIKGAAIFAGGPYDCSDGVLALALTSCMTGVPLPAVDASVFSTVAAYKAGLIADPDNMKNHSVFLFSGTKDETVRPIVMDALHNYYKSFVQTPVEYINTHEAAHTLPTDDPANQNPCTLSAPPYLSNCNYDGAGAALKKIYGSLNPRNDGPLNGQIFSFDQTEFLPYPNLHSLATEGFLYVPDNCMKGHLCKLHVSLHGCKQNAATVGMEYVKHSGFNKWADTNNLIILYPQTIKQAITPYNPNGCWDWWGYNGNPFTYPTREGVQIKMIRALIDRIASNFADLPAPKRLVAKVVTNNSVTLTWAPVAQAIFYDVFLVNGTRVNTQTITGDSYVATGLFPGTSYYFTVQAINAAGYHSASSPVVKVTTEGMPPPLDPPQGLRVLAVSSSSTTLSWEASAGATGYDLTRNGTVVASVSGCTYTDLPLDPQRTYEYSVAAYNCAYESKESAPVYARTEAAWTCRQITASNVDHVLAGRAQVLMGWTFARGSEECIGLWNVLASSTLAEVKLGYWAMTECPP